MISLVYISSAVEPFSDPQLADLLTVSRLNNTRAGITGMLVYKGGNFMQLIEGEPAAIETLQQRIRADPRHYGMVSLLRETITERKFDGWSMGFRNIHSSAIHGMEGYSDLLNYELTGKEFSDDPSRAQKLLLSFKRTM